MTYPAPDARNRTPNFTRTPDNDVLDPGWAEDALSDGRPVRAEWCQDQVTMLTSFISTVDLQPDSPEQFADLLVRGGLVQFASDRRPVEASTFRDPSGSEMWSITAVVADEDDTLLSSSVSLCRYARTREEKQP